MRFARIIDLSQPLYQECPGWPDYTPTSVLREYNTTVHGFNAETVTMNTHTGTHVDAPFHFFDDGARIGDMPVDTFAGPALFLDLRSIPADSPIEAEHLLPFKDKIRPGDIVVLVTGWAAKRGLNKEYMLQWPYLSRSGAELLVECGVKGVGIDTMSIGGWGSPAKGRPCHEVLLGAGKFIVEELNVPEELLDGRHHLFSCFPILMRDCGGAWARAVVYEISAD